MNLVPGSCARLIYFNDSRLRFLVPELSGQCWRLNAPAKPARLIPVLGGWDGATAGKTQNKIHTQPAGAGQEETLAESDAPLRTSWASHVFHFRRDFCAGGLMMLFGLVAAVNGPNYHVGTLGHMGPGFMPTALGVLLILLGIAICLAASVGSDDDPSEDAAGNLLPAEPQWFAWLCILAGPFLFIVFGSIGGMAPATFACVFVAALGDKLATWKSSFILAAVITVSGVVLFHYVLQIPMPVLEWRL